MTVEFFMPMQPPTKTFQAKKLGLTKKKKPMIFDSPELKDIKNKLLSALAPNRIPEPIDGPVRVGMKWIWAGEDDAFKWKTTKPDTDNLSKALLDSMTKLKFFDDDAQVASLIIEKMIAPQGEPSGIFVSIQKLD